MLKDVEDQMRQEQLSEHEFASGKHKVRIARATSRTGKEKLRYWFDGVRLERDTLRELVCTENQCPKHQQAIAAWYAHSNTAPAQTPKAKQPVHLFQLVSEERIEVDGKTFFARPATLQCVAKCPEDLHAPFVTKRQGFDLFTASGSYVAGGAVLDTDNLPVAPMFPSVQNAQQWLTQANI